MRIDAATYVAGKQECVARPSRLRGTPRAIVKSSHPALRTTERWDVGLSQNCRVRRETNQQ